MPNKKTKDSLGHDAAWAKWEKGYMDRTHKMKGTKFEKPITREENKKEMEMERKLKGNGHGKEMQTKCKSLK